MSKETKNIAASIKGRLTNIAKKQNMTFDSILLLYMLERILFRLSISKYGDKFVLKGGLLMLILTQFKSRPTKDIDFLAQQISNDKENIKNVFKEICNIEYQNDGLIFDTESVEAEEIKKDADYQGIRVRLNCNLGNMKKKLQMDIGFGDVIIPKEREMECSTILDMDAPVIKVYSLESVIAEKFQAMIALSTLNSRMKDFYDIYTILNSYDFDGMKLQQAVIETLQRRHTVIEKENIIFNNEFAKDEARNKMWIAFLRKINEKSNISFQEVMNSIIIFLKPIYDAIIFEKESQMEWDCTNKIWTKYVRG